jgi:hypothetical protein
MNRRDQPSTVATGRRGHAPDDLPQPTAIQLAADGGRLTSINAGDMPRFFRRIHRMSRRASVKWPSIGRLKRTGGHEEKPDLVFAGSGPWEGAHRGRHYGCLTTA